MEFFKKHQTITSGGDVRKTKASIKNGVLHDEKGLELQNNRALHGDSVFVNKENEVVGIDARTQDNIVGILHLNKSQKYGFTKKGVPIIKFTPLSNKYPTFMVPCKSKEKKAIFCAITINKWDTTNKVPVGKIEKIIGEVGDKASETEAILYKNSIFPRRVKIAVLKSEISDAAQNVYETFSIDPDGCRDIDDAFHVNTTETGDEIGIHIADVASKIDIKKSNISFFSSVYLEDNQINMLSDKLTFDEASLGNGQIKQAVSLIITYEYCRITQAYKLINFAFKKTCVKNTALTYKQADQKIAHGEEKMKILYQIMKQFSDYDDTINPIPATKIVEYYMLLYNTKIAETLFKVNPETILRIHKKTTLTTLLSNTHSEELCDYLKLINQNAAEYIKGNDTDYTHHESLGFQYYTHATSPIRRFVDIINQINIINIITKSSDFVTCSKQNIIDINNINKNLRKFYNNYKKLQIIFPKQPKCNFEDATFNAYITQIREFKIKIYIPELQIDHFVRISSKKLSNLEYVELGEKDETPDTYLTINIMGNEIKKYDMIKIKITILANETIFNNKIYCQMIEPNIKIL